METITKQDLYTFISKALCKLHNNSLGLYRVASQPNPTQYCYLVRNPLEMKKMVAVGELTEPVEILADPRAVGSLLFTVNQLKH